MAHDAADLRVRRIFLGAGDQSFVGETTSPVRVDGTSIAFFGAAPVAQPSTTGTTTGFTAGAGTAAKSDSTFTGNTGSTAYTVGDIVKALKDLGLLTS